MSTPFSFYNGRAHIVLPTELLSDPVSLSLSIAHEVQHHRQKDTLWTYYIEIARTLFGINPLAKKFLNQTVELQELACDEFLVGRKNVSPRHYGKCLYDFAEKQMLKQATAIGAVGMAAEAKLLKRRIEAMFHKRKNTPKRFLALTLVGSIFAFSSVSWALRGTITDQTVTLKEAKRLAKSTNSRQEIPIVIDDAVVYWLNKAVSTQQSRKYMRESLDRMKTYEGMIKKKLKASDLPMELLAVPLVESGYKNNVKSTMSAAGIWQFIPQTARNCGLKVSDKIDERWDAEKLTDAAVCYYGKLYAVFQNWHVVLAAYNVGEHRLTTEITSAGHNDVLRLAKDGKLGREGGSYLPKVIASMIILSNPNLVN